MSEENTDVLVNRMKHALGFGRRKPYTRHGRKYFKPYRNYYAVTYSDPIMDEAVKDGLLEVYQSEHLKYFYVTEKGRAWLGKKIGVIIHKNDDE